MQTNTKYEIIISYLEKQIADGVYDNNVRLPTEAALAKMFNVSRITAQRALDELELKGLIYRKQGSGSYVSENSSTSAKMKGLLELTDTYENTVSLILPYDSLGGRFNEIVCSAADVLEKYGYHLVLHNSRTDIKIEREILLKLMRTGIRGIIYYPHRDMANMDLLYEAHLKRTPLVTIDKKISEISVCGVYSDNFRGAYDLTQKLIDNGHTKIACFYYMDLCGVFTIRQRFFGYCQALHDNSIPLDFNILINYYNSIADEKNKEMIINGLLDAGVTAITTENDYTALDIIEICNQLKIKVPEQLSLVGFDNIPQSAYIKPSLTTAEQDFSAIGRLAAESIIAQIENAHCELNHIVPVKIIERNSIRKMRLSKN